MFLVGCWLWDDLSYLPWLVLGRLSRVVSTLKKRRATVKPCVVRLGCGRCICVVAHCDASTPDLWALSVPLGGIHSFHQCNLESIGCTLCVPSKREGVPHSDIVARKSPLVPINRSGALQCYLQCSLNQGAPPCGNALIEEPLHGIRTRRQIAFKPLGSWISRQDSGDVSLIPGVRARVRPTENSTSVPSACMVEAVLAIKRYRRDKPEKIVACAKRCSG